MLNPSLKFRTTDELISALTAFKREPSEANEIMCATKLREGAKLFADAIGGEANLSLLDTLRRPANASEPTEETVKTMEQMQRGEAIS